MAHTFTVKSESGKPDSLTNPVKIAFTLTPAQSAHPYDPTARWVTDFPANGEKTLSFEFKSVYYFDTYTPRDGCCKLSPFDWSDEVLVCLTKVLILALTVILAQSQVQPGQRVELRSSGDPEKWSVTQADSDQTPSKRSSMLVLNKSGSTQSVLLAIGSGGIVAYHPLEPDSTAYIVKDATPDDHTFILKPEDLTRPIFPSPLRCDELPASSTWRLRQDQSGSIQLRNTENPDLGYTTKPPVDELAKSGVEEMRAQLSELMRRVASLETSNARTQDDVRLGQEGIADIRSQLSTLQTTTSDQLSRSDRTIAAVEAKATVLEKSFSQSRDSLAAVQNAVGDTKRILTGMEGITDDLNRRVPVIEAKSAQTLDRLSVAEKSARQTQDQVSTIEKSVNRTRDDLSVVQQLAVSTNNQLSLMNQIPGAPMVAQGQSTGDLGRRVVTLEERTEKLEKEQRKYLRKIPVVEAKADKLETSLGQTQLGLAAVQVSFSGLDHRIGAFEARDRDDAETGSLPSSSAGRSPVTFPSQLSNTPSVP